MAQRLYFNLCMTPSAKFPNRLLEICDASQQKVPYVGEAYLEILSKMTE